MTPERGSQDSALGSALGSDLEEMSRTKADNFGYLRDSRESTNSDYEPPDRKYLSHLEKPIDEFASDIACALHDRSVYNSSAKAHQGKLNAMKSRMVRSSRAMDLISAAVDSTSKDTRNDLSTIQTNAGREQAA